MTLDPSPTSTTPDRVARHDDAAARVAAEPSDPRALLDLAGACLGMGGTGLALPLLERAESTGGRGADVTITKAETLQVLGLLEDARRTAAELIGTAPPEIVMRAKQTNCRSLMLLRRFDDAAAAIGELLRSGGGMSAIELLADLDEARGDRSKARDRLRAALHNPAVGQAARASMAYKIARLSDKLGDFDEAFESATLASDLGEAAFDLPAYEAETEALLQAFAADRIADLPRGTNRDERPVFIVGMPRSGTTLLEQIISAHPDAAGIQERLEIQMFGELLAGRAGCGFADAIPTATPAMLDEFAAAYLGMIDDLVPRLDRAAGHEPTSPRRVVNKALNLDRLTGFIGMMLPGARVIVIRRNPLDNLLSVHLNPMSPSANPWTASMEGLVAARRRFDRLTAHWQQTLEIPVMTLDYEDLVADPETRIRAILDFLDLPFDEACLQSHRSDRAVMTPSRDQVSKPINTQAVARWRRYERHLGPLLAAFPPDASG